MAFSSMGLSTLGVAAMLIEVGAWAIGTRLGRDDPGPVFDGIIIAILFLHYALFAFGGVLGILALAVMVVNRVYGWSFLPATIGVLIVAGFLMWDAYIEDLMSVLDNVIR